MKADTMVCQASNFADPQLIYSFLFILSVSTDGRLIWCTYLRKMLGIVFEMTIANNKLKQANELRVS